MEKRNNNCEIGWEKSNEKVEGGREREIIILRYKERKQMRKLRGERERESENKEDFHFMPD